jgi:hypothetical protein
VLQPIEPVEPRMQTFFCVIELDGIITSQT